MLMRHNIEDYTNRDLVEALKSPYWSEAKKAEFRAEQAKREKQNETVRDLPSSIHRQTRRGW